MKSIQRNSNQTDFLFCRNRSLKSISLASALMLLAIPVCAQNDKDVKLKGATVKAERIVSKTDGLLIYPTSVQKNSSSTGYSLIQKMAFPNIRVDEMEHTISAIDRKGAVQIRINDIIVEKAEMMSLDPKEVVKIDFIDNPGVRYGNGVAYVINIMTRRAHSGYVVGTDLTHGLTAKRGNGAVFGKWNTRKSEWALNYNAFYSKSKNNNFFEEQADYHLNDGSVYSVSRNDIASKNKMYGNDVKLSYNLMEKDNYTFQASLSGSFSHTPTNWHKKRIVDNLHESVAIDKSKDRSSSPVLDIYFSKQLPNNQSLLFNAVGTYINTTSSNSYDEGDSYRYDVKGKTYSLMSEGIYENKFKPLTFSAGFNYKQKYTHNKYSGSTNALNDMHNSRVYLFSDIRGAWKKFRYSAGLGASMLHNSQGEHKYDYWTFCPKVTLAYNLTDRWQVKYSFDCHERMSRIAMVSDATLRQNPMEWKVGSPNLKPSTDMENSFRLSYNSSRLQTFMECFYRYCHRPNMALYERTDDDRFIYTQSNQKEISVLQTMLYANYWILPEKLSLGVNGGLFRCFNFGDEYTHCYTSYFVNGSLNAYLGNFTISAFADNGFRFLEGETKGYNGSFASVKAAYNYKNWQFGITCQHPFTNNYKMFESRIINTNLQKHQTLFSKEAGNYVGLNISWTFNKGRKYHAPKRSVHLKDNDTGIIKK